MWDGNSAQQDMMVRAAWLSFVAERTQSEIASILGTSRVKVARLIAEARAQGLVSIEIDHRLSDMCAVEETLRTRFALDFCYATPPLVALEGEHRQIDSQEQEVLARRAVAVAAAQTLRRDISQNRDEEQVIGLAWGRTISAMADAFRPITARHTQFVSLLGSLTRSASANPFDVVQKLASKTSGEAKYLPVPFIADSEDDRNVFMQQKVVKEVVRTALRAKSCYISVGELDADSFLARHGYLSAADLSQLRSVGAVGDTMGKFFDEHGRYVDSAVCRRTVAIDLGALKKNNIVLLSAGHSKIEASRAILKAGAISGLIIDGDSAVALAQRSGD